jgi:hypothetical protein
MIDDGAITSLQIEARRIELESPVLTLSNFSFFFFGIVSALVIPLAMSNADIQTLMTPLLTTQTLMLV